MAIKIKNREKEPEETPDEEEEGLPVSSVTGEGLDGFERTTFLAANWVEENRKLIFGSVIAVVVAVLGVLIGTQYVSSQQVQASDRLSAGLGQYQVYVEGSPELAQIREREDIPNPERVFASDEEKWQAIYDEANTTLADFERGPIAASARFTKAAAALNLGNGEEAEDLYREVLATKDAPEELRSFAIMGLANSLAAQGDVEGSRAAWAEFAEADPTKEAYADFEVARLVERTGNTEEARGLYESFLEDHPSSEFVSEVERRLALL